MDPIHVPRPPKEAYNKNRPISDLIKAQLLHFQHLEQKLTPEQRPGIPHHELTTESAAARYIAAMTDALCRGTPAKLAVMPQRIQVRKRPQPAQGLPLAASAEEEHPSPAAPAPAAGKPQPAANSRARGKSR